MTCPDCKTNVQSDMKYCPVCGSALALHAPVNSATPSGIYLKWFDSFLKNSKMISYAWEEKNKLLLLIPIFIWLFTMFIMTCLFLFLLERGFSIRLAMLLLSLPYQLVNVLTLLYAVCYGMKKYHEDSERGFRIAILFLILSVLALILPDLLIPFAPYNF